MFIKQKTKKKNPNTDFVPKRQNQTKTPIVVVAIAKLAHRRRRLVVARPSSQSQIAVLPLIVDRSAQIRTSGAQLAASVRDRAPGPFFMGCVVRPNPREWVESCYCLSKWRFD